MNVDASKVGFSYAAKNTLRMVCASEDVLQALMDMTECFDSSDCFRSPQDIHRRCDKARKAIESALPPDFYDAWLKEHVAGDNC